MRVGEIKPYIGRRVAVATHNHVYGADRGAVLLSASRKGVILSVRSEQYVILPPENITFITPFNEGDS